MEEESYPDRNPKKYGFDLQPKRFLLSLALSVFAALALLFSLLFLGLGLLFFGNFDLGSLIHLFILAYTFSVPLLIVVAFFVYHFRPNKKTALALLLLSLASFGTLFVWGLGGTGLIH